jgi:hypothetical protein
VAVARPEVAAVVVSGMAATGPRKAAAFSMPGASPVARPAVGGGGANGSAGGTKLVTPGAAEGIGGTGRGVNICAAGASAAAGLGTLGGLTAALGGGANMLIAGACAEAND